MKKIYVLIYKYYPVVQIVGIYLTKEDALKAIDNSRYGTEFYIEELPVGIKTCINL